MAPDEASSEHSTPPKEGTGPASTRAQDSSEPASQTQSPSMRSESPSEQTKASSHTALSPNHIFTAVSLGLGLLLLRSGFLNLILVLATSAVLLLNPHVRTFLDLPASSKSQQNSLGSSTSSGLFGILDPARYFIAFSHRSDEGSSEDTRDGSHGEATRAERTQRNGEKQLAPLPPNLKQSLDRLSPLVVRDFIEGWYTHHSFGYPSFPRTTRSTIDHMALSIWTEALTSRLYAVDVATELLLTGSSVFLTCLRRKRQARAAAESGDRMAANIAKRGGTGHWNTNEERIASLRSAMRAFFERHLPPNERDSDLVFNLVTEILTKQLWNMILTVGEPDFLNRTLVEWKEKQTTTAPAARPAANTSTPPPSRPVSRTVEGDRRPPLQSISTNGPVSQDKTTPHLGQHGSASSRQSFSGPDGPPSSGPASLQRGSISSPTAQSLAFPDRNMISRPPSRSDSPMMPSFTATQSQQPRPAPRMMSPIKSGSVTSAAVNGGVPRTHSPPPYGSGQAGPSTGSPAHYRTARSGDGLAGRNSSDLTDGLSAVVGGLGNAIKGIGKGADAIAGGIGGALISREGDDFHAPLPPTSSETGIRGAGNDPWKRNPAAVDQASTHPEQLQQAHNAVRRKPIPGQKDSDWSDMMASQAAWPSNLPTALGNLAEGDALPDSLKNSLSRELQPSDRIGSPQNRRSVDASLPPSMTPSQPYEISPRQSQDVARTRTPSKPVSQRESGFEQKADRDIDAPARSDTGISTAPKPQRAMSAVPSAPTLESVLSRSDPEELYDAFESFLENPPNTVASSTVVGEGEELLRLQVGLATIERLVPLGTGQEAEMFREDASAILSKARDGLSRALRSSDTDTSSKPARGVLDRLEVAIAQLGFGPGGFDAKEGTVRDALAPVREGLMSRLTQLYEAFWAHRYKETRRPHQTGTSSGLAYEPRRKDTAAASTPNRSSAALSSVASVPRSLGLDEALRPQQSPSASSMPDRTTPLRAPKPRQPIVPQLIDGLVGDEDDYEHDTEVFGGSSGVHVSVTDISANVDRPNAPVDIKTFEFMCAVEPVGSGSDARSSGDAAGGGGFVLIRRWHEVVDMDKKLRRQSTANDSQWPSAASRLPALPPTKNRTSAMLSSDLEAYLAALLSSPELATLPPVLQFADRTRAATDVSKAGFNPFTSSVELGRNLGKNLVEGVGAVGKAAASGLGQQQQQTKALAGGVIGAGGAVFPPELGRDISSNGKRTSYTSTDPASALLDTATGAATEVATSSLSNDASAQSSQGLSSRALDALLTSIFALADEALSLTGAWSMRRGVVRLLQSVVRQSYSGAIVSAFDGTASALSTDAVAGWIDTIRTTFWANGPDAKWSHVKGPARSAKERIESEEKARAIVISYAPTQAAFVLGPGGKQACERGLEAVHGVICEDEGALDLALTLVLRLLQML